MNYNITVNQCQKSKIGQIDFDNLGFGEIFTDHMFTCEYENGKWVNPSILPLTSISMHPSTYALHYGQLVFEGMKAEKTPEGTPILFRPDKNIQRLNDSCGRLCMPSIPEALFLEGLKKLIDIDKAWIPQSEGCALYARPFMYAADEYLGISKSLHKFRFVIILSPVGKYYGTMPKVLIMEEYLRAFPGGVGNYKVAGNYAPAFMPTEKAKEQGYDQVLWLDGVEKKYVQEVGTMNIFFVIDNIILTPPLSENTILPGVTRDSIIRLAQNKGYKVEQRRISVDEIQKAFEQGSIQDVFGTGTAVVVSPIAGLGYKGVYYELPPLEDRQISAELKKELEDIKSGRKKPPYPEWVVPCC